MAGKKPKQRPAPPARGGFNAAGGPAAPRKGGAGVRAPKSGRR
jgi:hypothetical protein